MPFPPCKVCGRSLLILELLISSPPWVALPRVGPCLIDSPMGINTPSSDLGHQFSNCLRRYHLWQNLESWIYATMQNAAGLPSMYQQMAWPGWPGMAPSRSQWFDSSLHAGHSLSTGPYQPQPSLWSPYDYAAYYNHLYQVRQKQKCRHFWRNFHDWLHWNFQKRQFSMWMTKI